MRAGRLGVRRSLAAAGVVVTLLVGIGVTPASASPSRRADDGRRAAARVEMTTGYGTATASPALVVAPTPTSVTFTYTAAAGWPLTSGVVEIAVPSGWTAPSTANSTASAGTVSIVGASIEVSAVTLAAGQSLTVTYGVPTSLVMPANVTSGFDTFTVSVSTTSSGTPAAIATSPQVYDEVKASAATFHAVTSVPMAVFNAIGARSPSITLLKPAILNKQPTFVTRLKSGAVVPNSFYWGFDWCPFCGPTQWGVIVALSRFGHFNQLYEMTSSPTDIDPNTPMFTFHMATYTSPFLGFAGYDVEGPTMKPQDTPPRAVRALLQKYDPGGAAPFLDFGNKVFALGAAFDPSHLAGKSQDQIAADLSQASNPETRAIVAWANLLSAGICASDHERPSTVCRSPGVIAADRALHLPVP